VRGKSEPQKPNENSNYIGESRGKGDFIAYQDVERDVQHIKECLRVMDVPRCNPILNI
jgi:hypothetical protein